MLIITRDEAIGVLSRVLGVPRTGSVRDIPTHVLLDETDGMPIPCALALDNVGPVVKGHLTERITSLGPAKMAEVCRSM